MTIRDSYFRYLDHFGTTCTVKEMLERDDEHDVIALRHDVDHDIDVALEMAYWEHERGNCSTYYLLPTAPYWSDPRLAHKCRQLKEFGHEVGLHLNSISSWLRGDVDSVEVDLRSALERLRSDGVAVEGTSPHGDPACYESQFINYWCFKELCPADPISSESGLTAEGTPSTDTGKCIDFPADARIVRADGELFDFWSVSMVDLGLAYDAIHVPTDRYYSDSGGGWGTAGDPLDESISAGRVQVLMHPIHWRGEPRRYFFLSPARSGSTWLSHVLGQATPLSSRHEFTLNHRFEHGKPVAHKRTLDGLNELLEQPEEVEQLLRETRDWLEKQPKDSAEANVYLVHFFEQLDAMFPDAEMVFLEREPAKVVRSLMNRDWYDTPDDHRHPVVGVENWNYLDQFSKVCWYVRAVTQKLMSLRSRVRLERLTADMGSLSGELKRLRIPFYPVLAQGLLDKRINAGRTDDYPSFENWGAGERATFEHIFKSDAGALGGMGPTFTSDSRPLARGLESTCSSVGDRAFGKVKFLFQYRGQERLLAGFGLVLIRLLGLERRLLRFKFASTQLLYSGLRSHKGTRISYRNCEVGLPSVPLRITFNQSAGHAHVVLGGGEWYRLSSSTAWTATLGAWYHGEVDLQIDTDGPVVLYCLMYDQLGKQIYQRSLVQFSKGQQCKEFGFKTRAFAEHFCLAFYFPDSPGRKEVVINSITLTERLAKPVGAQRPELNSLANPVDSKLADATSLKTLALAPRASRVMGHFDKYRTYLSRLTRDIVFRFWVESVAIFTLTTVGIALIGAGFVSALQLLKSLGAGEPLVLLGTEISISSTAVLVPMSVGVGALFAVGAILQYLGRRKTFTLIGKYERSCIARTIAGVSRSAVPMTLPGGVQIGAAEFAAFLAKTPRVCSRLAMILFSVLRDIVIFAFSLAGIFYINPGLSVIVLATLAMAAPFLYSNNLYAVGQTRRFDRAARPAMARKRHLLEDALQSPQSLTDDSRELGKNLWGGPIDDVIRAFGGRLLSLERSMLITTLLAGVLFLEILLLMGSQLPEDDAVWASLLGFVVALQFFAISLTRAARGLTSITRFYPWVNPFYEFLDGLGDDSGVGEAVASVPSSIESLDPGQPGHLEIDPGCVLEVLVPGPLDRLTMSAVALSLSGGKTRRPWYIQEMDADAGVSVREHFGISYDSNLQLMIDAMPRPDALAGLEMGPLLLDGDGTDLESFCFDHQAVIGTLGCLAGSGDACFFSGRLWSELSYECRGWISLVLKNRLLILVRSTEELSACAEDNAILLVDGAQVAGWCRRAFLEAHPELYRDLKTTRVAAPVFDAVDEEEELG